MDVEKNFDNVSDDIESAANSMNIAVQCLRSCYINDDSSVPEFTVLRLEVTKYAKIYEKKVLPFSNAVVQHIKDFCEVFTSKEFSFDDFKECLPDLADEAKEKAEICKFTL